MIYKHVMDYKNSMEQYRDKVTSLDLHVSRLELKKTTITSQANPRKSIEVPYKLLLDLATKQIQMSNIQKKLDAKEEEIAALMVKSKEKLFEEAQRSKDQLQK